jgi:hypothetical protein
MDSGEMSFELFEYNEAQINDILQGVGTSESKLDSIASVLGEPKLPKYLRDFIENFSRGGTGSLAIHPSRTIANYKDADQARIERKRGFIGSFDLTKFPNAIHHIIVLYNATGRARVFYKYTGNIKFLKNLGKKSK